MSSLQSFLASRTRCGTDHLGFSPVGVAIEPAEAVVAEIDVAAIRVKAKRKNFTVKIPHYEHNWHANAESLENQFEQRWQFCIDSFSITKWTYVLILRFSNEDS